MTSTSPGVRRLRWVTGPNEPARLNLQLLLTPSIPTVFDNPMALRRHRPKALSRTFRASETDPGSNVLQCTCCCESVA